MAAGNVWYDENDQSITFDGLKDETGEYVNDATLTARLQDQDGADVIGGSWPITLSYVAGSNGKYRGVAPAGLTLTREQVYQVKVVVDDGAGGTGTIYEDVVVVKRKQ